MEDKGELTNLLIDMVQNQKQTHKSSMRVFVIVLILYTIFLFFLVGCFFWYESQFEYTYAYTEETTQEVDGDNATINNVEGNQYNDNAVHNEGE